MQQGDCCIHIGWGILGHKLLRAYYYKPSLMRDIMDFLNKYDKSYRCSNLHHALTKLFHFVTTPWPFYQWGIDILRPFPIAPTQLKFMIMGLDYSTKWIELEFVSKIKAERVCHFYWKKIIYRFSLPRFIVSDNGTQFSSTTIINLRKGMEVKTKFV